MSEKTTKKEEAVKLVGQASNEAIAAWKATHKGGIYGCKADGHISYFKNPSRQEVGMYLDKSDELSTIARIEDFMGTTFLGGSEAWRENDEIFLGMSQVVREKMNGVPVRLVNL